MKIFLFGATGRTGFEVLKRLVQDKHEVKVLVRDPLKLDLTTLGSLSDQIQVIQGDVFGLIKLKVNFKDCDLVISALGTGKNNVYTEVYSKGGKNILEAMRFCQVNKLITITSGAIDMSDPSTDSFFMNRIIRPNFNKVYYDQTRWETILDNTVDVDWICVRPTNLINKPFTGKYRVRVNHCPKKGWKIGRADLADFIVKQIDSCEYIQQKPVVAY